MTWWIYFGFLVPVPTIFLFHSWWRTGGNIPLEIPRNIFTIARNTKLGTKSFNTTKPCTCYYYDYVHKYIPFGNSSSSSFCFHPLKNSHYRVTSGGTCQSVCLANFYTFMISLQVACSQSASHKDTKNISGCYFFIQSHWQECHKTTNICQSSLSRNHGTDILHCH